jgi:hypothetical protein
MNHASTYQPYISFPRSAWECSLGRSRGPNPHATLEHQDLRSCLRVGVR